MTQVDPWSPWPLEGRDRELKTVERWMADDAVGGVVLSGPAGVGKTRLATEVHDRAQSRGVGAVRAVATEAARGVPFGAFAHLLPPPADGAPPVAWALRDAAAALARTGSTPERPLVLVDDAHLLDGASAAVVHQLIITGQAFVLVTLRDGTAPPDAITALWKDGGAQRLDVGPLDRRETEALLSRVFEGAVDGACLWQLWDASRGNALFLREAVLGAIESGALVEREGLWRLVRPLGAESRLADLFEARVADLAPAEREVLEIVALSEPITLELLARLTGWEAMDAVERRGLLAIGVSAHDPEARLAHPLHSEVLRRRLPGVRSVLLRTRLADLVEGDGTWAREDALRIAVWRLESGGPSNPGLMIEAARQALAGRDPGLAERLARSAWDAQPTAANGVVLAEALVALGRNAEAVGLLEVAAVDATDAGDDAFVAMKAAEAMFWGLGRAEQSGEILRAAAVRLADTRWRGEINAQLASLELLGGRPLVALDLVEHELASPDGRVLVEAATVAAAAMAVVGRTDEAADVAQRGFEARLALGDQQVMTDAGVHIVARALALTEAGSLAEAEATARMGYELALEYRSGEGHGWFSLMLGRVAVLRGLPVTAARFFREGAGYVAPGERNPLRRWCLAGRAFALAMVGDAAGATAALEALDGLGLNAVMMMEPEVVRGRAWTAVAAGDLRAGADQLMAAARIARESGAASLEIAAWHDLVRLGLVADALPRLRALADVVDGPLAPQRLAQAEALAAGDGARLLDVSGRFEQLGASLFAAETAAGAAVLLAGSGMRRAASEATSRVAMLAAHCEGARSPGLAVSPTRVPLTRREREVATLAAKGATSPAIAAALSLSVRTVENHLQRAYDKLGVTGRAGLAEVFGSAADSRA